MYDNYDTSNLMKIKSDINIKERIAWTKELRKQKQLMIEHDKLSGWKKL